MGTKNRELLSRSGLNIDELVNMLNDAFADEWLAYYQYWIGAKVAVGLSKSVVVPELIEHATDELRHADMLAERILQLGGTPLLHPNKWIDHSSCKYYTPDNPNVKELLVQNIKSEQCAIEQYNKIMSYTKDNDPVTYDIALKILEDEIDHEEELEAIQEDIKNS